MLFFCLALPAFAPASEDNSVSQDYMVKVWGADDGLTEGSATDVAQTPEGYLWVGTLFGSVLRFDGTRFVSYGSANTPEFLLKWGVPRLMVDQGGTLWISMVDGGLTTWDKQGFRSVFASTNRPDQMLWSAPGKVLFIYSNGKLLSGQQRGSQWNWETVTLPDVLPQGQQCADADGRVWYLRGEHEMGIWNGHETKTLTLTAGLEHQTIKVLTSDARGNIWIGTDRTLAEWQDNHFEVITPTNGEADLNIKRIVSSGSNLWVEANGRMRRCAGRQWLAESEGWNRELGKFNLLRFLHGDADSGLWSSVGDLGLIHVLADGTYHRLTTRQGLPSNTVHFAYQDRDGNTWTGYERGGLVQVRRRLFQSIGKQEGLNDNLVNTVCEDSQGVVWIGTHGGGIGRYENGVCTNLVLPGAQHVQDSCVVADAQGRVWIGAQGGGLWLCETGRMQQIVTPTQLQGYPRLMLPEKSGQLWVGTLWSIVNLADGNLTAEYTARTPGEHPTGLTRAVDGTIWAGTLAGLLLHWDGKQFITIEPPERNSLGRIWALWPAPDCSLWAGTEEGGLLHWVDGRFRRYTMKDGLPSDSIIQVVGDGQGNLWLGTRTGIVRILKGALDRFDSGELDYLPVSLYGPADGLLTIGSAIIFQPNCWCGRNGNLYFAMANSVAAVKPAEVHINTQPPTVALEELRADDKPVWPEQVGAILTAAPAGEKSLQPLAELQVGRGHADMEFRYTGLSLGSPAYVRFKYRLEGLEKMWHNDAGERKAVYRHVPPGNYVLHVIAGNSDGVWSTDAALMTVTVRPYFYQTAWFRIAAGLSLLAGLSSSVAWAMRRRVHRRLEQLRRQHELQSERSRIAQDLHDDLGAGLTEISLLGGMLQDPSRFSSHKQQSLQRIVQRCHDLVVALDEIVWAVNPRNDSVNSLAGYFSRYAQSFLEPTAIRCRLEVQEADLDYPFDSEQRHNLFLAFKEALTNVVKHSGATEVRIKISFEEKERLIINIEDNGRGLPRVVKDDEGADGLHNLHQRMSQIGGQCKIANQPSGGVVVNLRLPLAAHRRDQP
jgi:signal transduction histidine kinase/ligand-binding sensor domain-containing protein